MASVDHDDDVDVDELDSAAIAAAMGFSSFGAQAHPNKKRRFNPQADAVIGTPRDSRPPARLPGAGTGANATRLPPRPTPAPAPTSASTSNSLPLHPPHSGRPAMKLPPPTVANADEIDLDDDEDEDDKAKESSGGVRVGQDDEKGTEDADELGPQYLDTSRPIGEVRDHLAEGGDGDNKEPTEDNEALQARIDAVVAAGNAAYGMAGAAGLPPRPQQHQMDGASHSTSRNHAGVVLHNRHGFQPDLMPNAASFASIGGGDAAGEELAEGEAGDTASQFSASDAHSHSPWQSRGQGRGQGRGSGHGHGHQRDWWTGYYDPTSNENPWARIEAKLGLPPCEGSWLERSHGRGQNHGQNRGKDRGQRRQGPEKQVDEAAASPTVPELAVEAALVST